MATIKLGKFKQMLTKAADAFSDSKIKEIQLPILKLYEGLAKYRIFTEGKASDDDFIGTYRSLSHKKARAARGRQTGYKDLEFEGDLRRSLTVGTNGKDIVFGFATDKARLIGKNQEKQTGKAIFRPTRKERSTIKKQIAKSITKCLKDIL